MISIPTPEHDKLTKNPGITKVSELSAAIAAFVDWLATQGIVLAVENTTTDEPTTDTGTLLGWTEPDQPRYVPLQRAIRSLLADYFEVNENALEAEKRALLKHLAVSTGI